MMERLFCIFLIILCNFPSYSNEYVRPESFGAVGNGIIDDTKALQKAFDSGCPLQLDGVYLINKNLTIKNNLIGSGRILVAKNDVSLYCSSDGVTIKGLTFDYQQHEGKLMRLKGASNVTIEDCEFLNVGNHSAEQSEGMVLISHGSHHIRIKRCRFVRCLAFRESSSAGVWVNFSKAEERCHHIYVDSCYFDDFQPSKDADAVKILGQNEDVFVYISNCEFYRCNKRALKLQARECHSTNNNIYVSRPMYCAIDFQRGHGTSFADSIIIDYDGISPVNPNAGLLYRAICIAQGKILVKKLIVEALNSVDNTHQIAIGFQSFKDYDNGSVSNVIFDGCNFNGQSNLITASETVQSVSDIKLLRSTFKPRSIKKQIKNIESLCTTTMRKHL